MKVFEPFRLGLGFRWNGAAGTSRAGTEMQERCRGHTSVKDKYWSFLCLLLYIQPCEWIWEICGVFKLRMKVIQAVAAGVRTTLGSNIDRCIVWHLLQFRLLLGRKCHFHIFHCKWSVKSLLLCETDNTKLPFGDGKLTSGFIYLTSSGILSLTLRKEWNKCFSAAENMSESESRMWSCWSWPE